MATTPIKSGGGQPRSAAEATTPHTLQAPPATTPRNPYRQGTAQWVAWQAQQQDAEYQADLTRRAAQTVQDAEAERERNRRAPWNHHLTDATASGDTE